MAPTLTCDTTVVIAGLNEWHPRHSDARQVLLRTEWLPAHVVAESVSVLSRLPHGYAVPIADAVALVRQVADGRIRQLRGDRYVVTLTALAGAGLGGGAVYDALVGATARDHEATLITLDERAQRTYHAVGAHYQTLPSAGD